jgi:DNA polymerase III alpha subunit
MKIKSVQVIDDFANIKFDDISDWYNNNLAPDKVDLTDQNVYENIYHNGKWAGIFQASQKPVQRFFEKAKPKNIIDIATLTSIWRPGPLAANVHDLYLDSKNGKKYDWGDERINKVLSETENCLIFQESVMELANKIAGFPLDECDNVRKAITKKTAGNSDDGKKKSDDLRNKFVNGCLENNFSKEVSEKLFDRIQYFAAYGFNKCLHFKELVPVYDKQGTFLCNKYIADVSEGDFVRSRDEETKKVIYVRVKRNYFNGVKDLLLVTFKNGKSIRCTKSHKFRTSTGEMLPIAKIIQEKRKVYFSGGNPDHVESYKEIRKDATNDIEVDHKDHQFFLANGLLTSNSHAVSYAINSYLCAWLLHYYEAEWLCAYLEYMSNPDDIATAFREVKSLGWNFVPIDINFASKEWTILSGKRFMPSFLSCKGLGEAAVDEILKNRPYSDIYNFLWKEDGTWRHSKFNKKSLETLIKIRAFDSLNCIGENKLFSSYQHMFYVLIENYDLIKKTSSRDPEIGKKNLKEIAEKSYSTINEWSNKEMLDFKINITGSFNVSEYIPQNIFNKFTEHGVKCIDEIENDLSNGWFIVENVSIKKTKTNKIYYVIDSIGFSSKKHKIYVWTGKNSNGINIEPFSLYIAELSKTDFGFSANEKKLKQIKI